MSGQPETTNSDYKKSLLSGLQLFHNVSPDDVQTLLDRADKALYASKVHGRNRFSVDIE